MDNILKAQRQAFMAELPVSADVRRDRLDRCLALLAKYRDPLCDAMDRDFEGRHRVASLMNDMVSSSNSLKHARRKLTGWMKPSRRRAMLPFNLVGARVEVEYQPKGVVGIMGAWNFPVFLILSPLAYVLAAGNRAMLKPSELAPETAMVLAQAFAEYFDPSEVAVITGGRDVAERFARLPFDHLLMTGSTAIGHKVMAAASAHLVPVTLELGGKSPALIGSNADIGQAAQRITDGKLMNNGQVCVSPDYVCVAEDQLEPFLAAARTTWNSRVQAGNGNELTAIINDRHYQRICGYIEQARESGARIEAMSDAPLSGRRMHLTAIINPPLDSDVMREEIFGPVMPVLTYRTIDEMIGLINSRPRPLALYYFGRDRQEERLVLDSIIAGGVTVNDVLLHVAADDAPFGGIGPSGIGHYHGVEGFREFSHAKSVFRAGWFDPRRLFNMGPPYSDKMARMLEKML